MSAESEKESVQRGFLQKCLMDPLRLQLTQGADPKGLAMTFAVGASLALIPVLGVATFLCVAVGFRFKLNQPILQAINYLLYPLQLLLIPVFLKLGGRLFGEAPIVFNLVKLTEEFKQDAGLFFEHYGRAGLHAFLFWLICAPLFASVIYQISLRLIRKMKTSGSAHKNNSKEG